MKKVLSIVLAVAMVLSLCSLSAFAAEDLNVDISALPTAAENYGPHGYEGQKLVMFGYGSVVSLGTLDLSAYDSCEITYATDLGYKAFQDGMNATAMWALKNNGETIGYVNVGPNEDGLLGKADCTDASADLNPDGINWGKGQRTSVIDLSGVDYNGEVFLSHFNSTGNEALLVSLKFVAKKASAPTDNSGAVDFLAEGNGHVGMSLDVILWNGAQVGDRGAVEAYFSNDGTLDGVALGGQSVGYNGWVAFTQEVKQFGYMINGNVVFDSSFTVENEATLTDTIRGWGGDWANSYPQRFLITVPLEGLTGTNEICGVIELADGTVVKMNDNDIHDSENRPYPDRQTTLTIVFGDPAPETNIQTGDAAIAMFAVVLVAAMGAAVVFSKKRAF